MRLTIYTDGGSLNNPGEAAIAYILYEGEKVLMEYNEAIGVATNNIAEYTALLKALTKAKEYNPEEVQVYSDSELMVRQLNGIYKVKDASIRELLMKVRIEENQINAPIIYTHVLREKNSRADALVKKALGR